MSGNPDEGRVPLSYCPQCEKPLDGATFLGNATAVPTEGSLSVCLYCGSLNVFRADQTLRRMPYSQFKKLPLKVRQFLDKVEIARSQVMLGKKP